MRYNGQTLQKFDANSMMVSDCISLGFKSKIIIDKIKYLKMFSDSVILFHSRHHAYLAAHHLGKDIYLSKMASNYPKLNQIEHVLDGNVPKISILISSSVDDMACAFICVIFTKLIII